MAVNYLESWSTSSSGSLLITVLVTVGVLTSTNALYRVLKGAYVYFLRPGKSIKQYGPWAVVTGATDGIGRAYADALAKKGLNVVLVSRTKAKLDAAASEIAAATGVQTKVVVADFSSADQGTWEGLREAIAPLDVGILVNNVGLSYDHAEFFDAIDDTLIDDLVQVNIQATNKVTRIVLPGMKKRKHSAIVNIGSAAATVAPSGPLYAVYAGTKAYVDMFSKSLSLEYAGQGISVQNQAPMYVATKMSKIRRPTLDAPSPKAWVASAIKHIGYEATSCPYWFHGLTWGLVHNLPVWLTDAYLFKFHLMLRGKYLKKVAREAKKV